jgi:hypothetical protein
VQPAAEEKVLIKGLKHRYYSNKAGGLCCIWVQLLYINCSKTNGVVSSEPLVQSERGRTESERGRAVLRGYVATTKGQKVAKYIPF